MRRFFYRGYNESTNKSRANLIKRLVRYSFFLIALPFFLLYSLRGTEIVHSTILFFYKNPVIWKGPLFILIFCLLLFSLPCIVSNIILIKKGQFSFNSKKIERLEARDWRELSWIPIIVKTKSFYSSSRLSYPAIFAIFFFSITFFLSLSLYPVFNGAYTYKNYQFSQGVSFPETEKVEGMSLREAENLASRVSLPPGYRLKNGGTYFQDNQFKTSFQIAPLGAAGLSDKTVGFISIGSDEDSKKIDQLFQKSPNTGISDNITWDFYRDDFFSDMINPTFVQTDRGPAILISKIKYKGCFLCLGKSPYFAGNFLVFPNGDSKEVTDLSFNYYPKDLAAEIQKSYSYKNGVVQSIFFPEKKINLAEPGPVLTESGIAWAAVGFDSEKYIAKIFISQKSKTEVFSKKSRLRLNRLKNPSFFGITKKARLSDPLPVLIGREIYLLVRDSLSKKAFIVSFKNREVTPVEIKSGSIEKVLKKDSNPPLTKDNLRPLVFKLKEKIKEQERLLDSIISRFEK